MCTFLLLIFIYCNNIVAMCDYSKIILYKSIYVVNCTGTRKAKICLYIY